jgi:hypothetical protein
MRMTPARGRGSRPSATSWSFSRLVCSCTPRSAYLFVRLGLSRTAAQVARNCRGDSLTLRPLLLNTVPSGLNAVARQLQGISPKHCARWSGPWLFGDMFDLQKSGSGGGIGGSQCRRSHVGKASLQSRVQTADTRNVKASRPSAASSAHRSGLRDRRLALCGGILIAPGHRQPPGQLSRAAKCCLNSSRR